MFQHRLIKVLELSRTILLYRPVFHTIRVTVAIETGKNLVNKNLIIHGYCKFKVIKVTFFILYMQIKITLI